MLVTTVLCWIFIVKFQQKNLPVLFVEAGGGSELHESRAGALCARAMLVAAGLGRGSASETKADYYSAANSTQQRCS